MSGKRKPLFNLSIYKIRMQDCKILVPDIKLSETGTTDNTEYREKLIASMRRPTTPGRPM